MERAASRGRRRYGESKPLALLREPLLEWRERPWARGGQRACGHRGNPSTLLPQRPSYASWVSFFPGHEGEWYLGLEEVTLPDPPLPQCSPEQWYEMFLPTGYDKSQHRMEAVHARQSRRA